MNVEVTRLKEESSGVQAHLGIMQSVIQRMASNSAFCKTWCITLVSAILVIDSDKGSPEYALIAAILTILFLFLDIYYLALEKMFRDSYNSFVKKLHESGVESSDLYAVSPTGSLSEAACASLKSIAIWPFYPTLLVMILLLMLL